MSKEMFESLIDYMEYDGLEAYQSGDCRNGWATLHLVDTLAEGGAVNKK